MTKNRSNFHKSLHLLSTVDFEKFELLLVKNEEKEEAPKEIKYQVIFDEPFLGGMKLRLVKFLYFTCFLSQKAQLHDAACRIQNHSVRLWLCMSSKDQTRPTNLERVLNVVELSKLHHVTQSLRHFTG